MSAEVAVRDADSAFEQAKTRADNTAQEVRVVSLAEVLSEAEHSRASTRLKYLLVGSVLKGKPFPKGVQPWQGVDVLESLVPARLGIPLIVAFRIDTDEQMHGRRISDPGRSHPA